MFRKLIVIVLVLAVMHWNKSSAQLVNANFENLEIAENFETGSSKWTIASNNDNLFLIQNGAYLLNRKNTLTPYAIISGWSINHDAYKIITSLNLQKATDENSSIGLMFALQNDRRGGYLFELNKEGQFRLRQIAGSNYIYLTGSEKNGGWEKSNVVNLPGTVNLVEVWVADHTYDIYLNKKFIKTVTNKVYSTGSFGFVIGPGSKGSIDFLHIYTNTQVVAAQQSDGSEVAGLAQSIIKLKTEVNRLKEENELLHKTLNAVKSESQNFDGEKSRMQQQLTDQQNDYNVLLKKNDSLVKVNADLNKYKELIADNDNGDLVINLSKSLKAEKEKTTSLQLENKKLKEELNTMQQQTKISTPQNNEPKKPDEFILPK